MTDLQHEPMADGDDTYALPSTVLSTHRNWTLLDAGETSSSTQEGLAQAFVLIFPACVEALHDRWPLPEGVSGYVVLGSEQACLDWSVDDDAVGFHAVCAPFTDENEEGFDLPDDHRCYINLAGLEKAMADARDDQATRISALMTMPHEMGHVALFARYTAGRTPLQVFDQGGGEMALRSVMEAIEDEATQSHGQHSGHGADEDVVESFAAQMVDQWMEGNTQAHQAVDDITLRRPHKKAPAL